MSLVGTRIGHILIEEQVGRGGMGEVYRGFDEALHRKVAVKSIRAEHRFSAESRARFLREARLLSRLDHPGICRVYDLVAGQDADYLILEYIEGRTLRRVLGEALSETEKLEIAAKVAQALAAAHRERIVHRDLKPENIMLAPDGAVKVLDFGIARSLRGLQAAAAEEVPTVARTVGNQMGDSGVGSEGWETEAGGAEQGPERGRRGEGTFRTTDGAVAGTIAYMSPEQAQGAEVTEASDMYSFGIILHELATGMPAYGGKAGVDLLVRVAGADTAPVSGLDPDLELLIRQLEAADPGHRPTAQAAVDRLRFILDRPNRLRRRRLTVAALAATGLLLAGTALVTRWMARPRPLFSPGQERRVVLIPCVNETGDPSLDWVGRGLMEMVATTLDEMDGVDVVPVEDVVRAMKESGRAEGREVDRETAIELASALGARLAVASTLRRSNGGVALRYQTVNVNGSSASRELTASEPIEAARVLSARLAPRLNPEAPYVDIADRFSSSPFINRLYALGLQRLRTLGAKEALRYFEVCLDDEPDFSWARLQLATGLVELDRWDEAEKIVEPLRVDAGERGDRTVVAASLDLLARLRYNKGLLDEAFTLGEQALALHREADDASGEAVALYRQGDVRRSQRRLEEARALYQASLEVRRRIGDRFGEAHSLHGLGVLYAEQGMNEEGERLLREALGLETEMGLRRLEAMSLNSLGIMAQRRKDFASAEQLFRRSMQIHGELGSEQSVAFVLNNLAILAQDQGKLDEAYPLLLEAYEISRRLGEKESSAVRAFNLAFLLATQHRPGEAEPYLAEARAWFGEEWDVLVLEALVAAEREEFSRAFELQRRAKALAGSAWDAEQEGLLAEYRRRAASGSPDGH